MVLGVSMLRYLSIIFLFSILWNCSTPQSQNQKQDQNQNSNSSSSQGQDASKSRSSDSQSSSILRSATKSVEESDTKNRSSNDFPLNGRPGGCYAKKVIPAEYKTEEEKTLVSPGGTKTENVPEVVEVYEDKILDTMSAGSWKKSAQNDLYYLDEGNPTYRVVRKEYQRSPAGTRTVEVPPEYKIETKKVLVKEEQIEWIEVLCGNNAKPPIIEKIQKSLKSKNYDPGRTDGQLDQKTMDALNKYQKDNNLKEDKEGLINLDTIKSLGVQL
jgi:hypothetical protein